MTLSSHSQPDPPGGPLEHKNAPLPIMSLSRTIIRTPSPPASTSTSTSTSTSPSCRFCHVPLTFTNRMRSPLAKEAVFKDAVCDRKACIDKTLHCCRRMLPCGHACGGYKDEIAHPRCLHPSCIDIQVEGQQNHTLLTQHATDACSCGVGCMDPLGSAPVLQLQCEHLVHKSCVEARIRRKCPTARVSFEHLSCPLCVNTTISHPSLTTLLTPLLHFRSQMVAKSIAYMKQQHVDYEKILNDANPSNRFYGDIEALANELYSFYACAECSIYFATTAANHQQRVKHQMIMNQTPPHLIKCAACKEKNSSPSSSPVLRSASSSLSSSPSSSPIMRSASVSPAPSARSSPQNSPKLHAMRIVVSPPSSHSPSIHHQHYLVKHESSTPPRPFALH